MRSMDIFSLPSNLLIQSNILSAYWKEKKNWFSLSAHLFRTWINSLPSKKCWCKLIWQWWWPWRFFLPLNSNLSFRKPLDVNYTIVENEQLSGIAEMLGSHDTTSLHPHGPVWKGTGRFRSDRFGLAWCVYFRVGSWLWYHLLTKAHGFIYPLCSHYWLTICKNVMWVPHSPRFAHKTYVFRHWIPSDGLELTRLNSNRLLWDCWLFQNICSPFLPQNSSFSLLPSRSIWPSD